MVSTGALPEGLAGPQAQGLAAGGLLEAAGEGDLQRRRAPGQADLHLLLGDHPAALPPPALDDPPRRCAAELQDVPGLRAVFQGSRLGRRRLQRGGAPRQPGPRAGEDDEE